MSIRSKVFAATAALTLIGGASAGALTATTANAATPSCGGGCVDPFSYQFGTHHTPNYVMDVYRQGEKTGQPVILFRSSNNDPAEDFTASLQGQVSTFYAAGLVPAGVDLHYGGGCALTGVTTPVLGVPAAPPAVAGTGGTVAVGTYKVEVTYVNGSGETTASSSTTVVTAGTHRTITISPPAAEGNATGWYAYVTQASGSVYTRQQAAGSPTAIGSNLVLTTTPTLTGANPPATNTATLPPVTGCTSYYPDLYAWELQYAPYGVDSGLCVGVAATAVSGEKVTLQPCGVSSKTVLITDTVNAAGWGAKYVPVIDGSDTNFSHPFVLDYPHNGFPTDVPRPQLLVNNLTGFSTGSFLNPTGVIDTQEWGADFGILP